MASTLVILRNEYGGTICACARHIEEKRQYLGGQVEESAIDDGAAYLYHGSSRIAKCQECEQEERTARVPDEIRAALLDPKCSHTRFRRWCGAGIVYVYHRDPSSPSGVMLAASAGEDTFNRIYDDLRSAGLISSSKSPLSPTEGLRS